MKKIMGLYLFCLTFLWVSVASAKSLYVSVNGADKHTGEIDQPLRTIRVALNRAQPGDTIIIGPGTYRETIRASKKRDLTIKATREGDVQIVGTELLPQAWSEGDGGDLVTDTITADLATFSRRCHGLCSTLAECNF